MSSISTTTTSPLQRTSPGDELLLSNAPLPDDGLPDLEDYPRKNANWEEQEDERVLDRTEDAVLIPTRQGTSLGDEMLMSDPPMPSHGPPYSNRYLRKITEWKEREDERLLDRQEEAELRPRTTSEERKAAQFEKQAAEKAKQEAKAKNELLEKDKRLKVPSSRSREGSRSALQRTNTYILCSELCKCYTCGHPLRPSCCQACAISSKSRPT